MMTKAKLGLGSVAGLVVLTAFIVLRSGSGPAPHNSFAPILPTPAAEKGQAETQTVPLPSPAEDDLTPALTLRSWSDKLAEVLDLVRALTNLNEQASSLQRAVDRISIADLPAAMAVLPTAPRHALESQFRALLLTRWARSEAASAADWVEQNLHDSGRVEALQTVARAWLGTDQNTVLEWARQLPEAEERSSVLTSLAYEISRTDPATASSSLAELLPGKSRDGLATHIAALWASTNPAQAMEWAAALSSEDLRDCALAAVAATWAETDPLAAGALAVKSLPAGKVQEDAVMAVVQRWTQQEPAQAAVWVTGFPEGALRDTAVEELVKLWAEQQMEEAGKWVHNLAAGPTRDVAVGAYVGTIAAAFPHIAAAWVDHIGDETLRHREIERVAESWLGHDAASARVWLAETQLPEQRKNRLLGLKFE